MTNRTSKHIGKSILTGLPYIFLIAYDDFDGKYGFIMIPIFMIVFALLVNFIPLIIYGISYLFTRNNDRSKNIFNRSFNIIFWIWMILTTIGGISTIYTNKKMDEYKRTGEFGMVDVNNIKTID
tara:strand:- start:1288 stop:1659 length:372 start_codon:yes stop_codon:yes gene_type:complete